MSDVVKIKSWVEWGRQYDEMVTEVARAEWDAMTLKEQEDYVLGVAVDHQNEVAPCGAEVMEDGS